MKLTRTFLIGLSVFAALPLLLLLKLSVKHSLLDELEVIAILSAVSAATWVMGYGAVVLARNAAKGGRNVPLLPGEQVEHRVPANRMTGYVTHGGHLTFTNQRIFFEPHAVNFNVEPAVIAWSEVRGMTLGMTTELGILKLGATLATARVHGGSVSFETNVGGGSEALVIRHGHAGQTESHFVVFREPRLVALLASGVQRSPLAPSAG
jgi:hypothetical protein